MIIQIAVAAVILLGLFVSIGLIDEGRRDLRIGADGHSKIIGGVCIGALMLICGIALAVTAFGG